MKTAASISTCWAAMLALLALLLVSAPATAQPSIPGISPAPAPVTATLAPTANAQAGTVNPPPAATEEDDEEPVVIDILVAGDGRNQTGAITALLKVLAARSDMTPDHSKVNATVEWEPKKRGHHDNHDRRLRRALRTVPLAKKAVKDVDEDELDLGSNSTNCQMILNGGNYSVVHITLHGSSEKAIVTNILKLLASINPSMFEYVCKTNVRLQSQAPPANFAPMAEEGPADGLSGGQKAGIAIGVIGGAAVVGAVGFFAFKGFGAAAATV